MSGRVYFQQAPGAGAQVMRYRRGLSRLWMAAAGVVLAALLAGVLVSVIRRRLS